MTLTAGFSVISDSRRGAEVGRLCDAMEAADKAGCYPRLTVERPWSEHNPLLEGEFAAPAAIRGYLERELGRLAAHGARISVRPGRKALDLHDPRLGPAVDETRWDLRRKKLFLFAPERMALSIDRLRHYTGTSAEMFQRYVLLTNYAWHVEEFRAMLPGCIGPDSDGRQMPAWHHLLPGRTGLTMVNIGVGPSNAKTITDHLAVLRPDLVLAVVEDRLRVSRALAVDMESATVAANGFRYRIPTATLLAVSDKPLHARPKLSADAQGFYAVSRRQHVEISISVAEKVRQLYPGGLPTADLRSPDEPLPGISGPEATPRAGDAAPRP